MSKQIRIEKEHGEDTFCVLTTRNGFQWTGIFTGTVDECKRIMKAFIDVGYQEVKDG